jgi:hypothetical protein
LLEISPANEVVFVEDLILEGSITAPGMLSARRLRDAIPTGSLSSQDKKWFFLSAK